MRTASTVLTGLPEEPRRCWIACCRVPGSDKDGGRQVHGSVVWTGQYNATAERLLGGFAEDGRGRDMIGRLLSVEHMEASLVAVLSYCRP